MKFTQNPPFTLSTHKLYVYYSLKEFSYSLSYFKNADFPTYGSPRITILIPV